MNSLVLLFGLLPALAFLVAALFFRQRTSLWIGAGCALAEMAYTVWVFRTLDALTFLSLLLVVALGAAAALRENERIFRLYPAAQSLLFALVFLFFYHALNSPLLSFAVGKYLGDQAQALARVGPPGFFARYLELLSRDLGWWFLGHGLLALWTAVRGGRLTWTILAVFGQLAVVVLGVLVAAFFAARP